MSVTPSPIGGFAAQFFDNNGVILSGGKIYTYAAGTTTPQATYTSAAGVTPHANPIILDSAGRVPGGEIWLTDGLVYKFVIETAASILIGTYDNITGVNSNFVNYTVQEEVITATAGQTVFDLSTINYTPGTNSLSVYIDGVNQYVGDSYLETDSDTVTFTSGVHVGGEVKFTTAVQTTTGAVDASIVSFTGFNGQTGSVQDLADDDGSDWIGFDAAGTGAVARSAQEKMRDVVSVKDFGAVGDGVVDDTAAIQAAIDAVSSVEFPAGYTFVTSGNTIGSNKTLVINGTVLLKAASPIGAKMFVNDNQVGGNTNIKMLGDGVLDGNKANQTGVTDTVWHTLVDIDNCDYFEFAVAKITGNYFPIAVTAGNTTGAVYIRNSDYVSVHDSLATDYGREAFWCETCNESSMTNLKGVGGTDSWSVVQFSGNRNIASNIYANNAGAAGASFDITNSTISNVVNYNNRFQNGVNFGHAGIPADYSTATNIVSINAAIGSTNAGIQVAASTVGFVLDGFQVSGSAGPGVRVSDGSDNIRISGGISTGNTGFGLVLFTAAATDLPRFYVSNVDLRGNTAGDYSRSGGTVAELFRNVRLSDDPMVGFQAINGLGIGGTVTVTNGNVVSTSVITANASNLAGANAVPLVQSIVDGSFVIQTVNSGGGGAGLRYYIS
jgi:hypothetical protein